LEAHVDDLAKRLRFEFLGQDVTTPFKLKVDLKFNMARPASPPA